MPVQICRSVVFVAALAVSSIVSAGIINTDVFTGTPEGSWRYSELHNAGKGQSIAYFPTSTSEFSDAVFQGYVAYDSNLGVPGWYGTHFDSIQVFSTSVVSSYDQSILLRFGGDDGHSLFVDDLFVAGGGFGVARIYNLSLIANVPSRLDFVGYNGPGNWVFEFALEDSGTFGEPLDNVVGVRLNADGVFSLTPIPEPSSLLMWLVGVGGIFLVVKTSKVRSLVPTTRTLN